MRSSVLVALGAFVVSISAAPTHAFAQSTPPGKDGMWRTRMDSAMIEKVYGWAKQRNALLLLDVQVGRNDGDEM